MRSSVIKRILPLLLAAQSVRLYVLNRNDFLSRCRLHNIHYNDCLNSTYRQGEDYDSFIRSFNIPIEKDPMCGFVPCRISILGGESNRVLNVGQSHLNNCDCPSGGIICECTPQSQPQPQEAHSVSAEPSPPKTVSVTSTVSITATSTISVTSTVSLQSVPTVISTPISISTSASPVHPPPSIVISTVTVEKPITCSHSHSHHSHSHSHPHSHSHSHVHPHSSTPSPSSDTDTPSPEDNPPPRVITIPYSTHLVTTTKMLTTLKTVTKNQYFVNTKDHYITETCLKKTTSTVTKDLVKTSFQTVTETVSDYIIRENLKTTTATKLKTVEKVTTLVVSSVIPTTSIIRETSTLTLVAAASAFPRQTTTQYVRSTVTVSSSSPEQQRPPLEPGPVRREPRRRAPGPQRASPGANPFSVSLVNVQQQKPSLQPQLSKAAPICPVPMVRRVKKASSTAQVRKRSGMGCPLLCYSSPCVDQSPCEPEDTVRTVYVRQGATARPPSNSPRG